MEEIKVSEMLQADSINKDDSVMIIQEGVNKKASGSIQTATGTSLSLTSVADTCKVTSNSKNIFNEDLIEGTPSPTAEISRIIILTLKPNTEYTMSSNVPQSTGDAGALFFFASGTSTSGITTSTNGIWNGQTRTFTSDANGNMIIGYRRMVAGDPDLTNYWYQIQEGDTASAHEPYNTEVKILKKNLIDNSKINNLWIGAAGDIVNQNYAYIQKYRCNQGDTFTLTATYDVSHTDNIIGIAFYSADGTLLKRTANNTTYEITETAPTNTNYMWAGHYYKIPKTMQLEFGNATTYEPYECNTIDLKAQEEAICQTYENLTNVMSSGDVTIEYNTNSRITNSNDIPDTNTPKENLVHVGTEINDEYKVNFRKSHNLFDLDKFFNYAPTNQCTKTKTANGFRLDFTAGNDAFVGFAGNGGYLTDAQQKYVMEVKPLTSYTLSLSTSTRNSSYITYVSSTFQVLNTSYIQMTNLSTYRFTTPANTKYVVFRFGLRDSSTTYYFFSHIMLNEGYEPLEYEPYFTPSINVDRDEIFSDNKVKSIVNNSFLMGQFKAVTFNSTGGSGSITFNDNRADAKGYLIFATKSGTDGTYCDILFVRMGATAIVRLGGTGTGTPTVSISGTDTMTISGLGTYAYVVVYQVIKTPGIE